MDEKDKVLSDTSVEQEVTSNKKICDNKKKIRLAIIDMGGKSILRYIDEAGHVIPKGEVYEKIKESLE